MTTRLSPYLFFDGDCREAMEAYRDAFGGTLGIQSYGEVDPNAPEAMKDRTMHAQLTGGLVDLMAGDVAAGTPLSGSRIQLALHGTDEERLRGLFETLSAGGRVVDPLERQAWGDLYGALDDRFGIRWMVNIG